MLVCLKFGLASQTYLLGLQLCVTHEPLFLCLSPSLNSIKGQAYNFMSSNFDVSKPSPWIPFHTYLTPNRATFQNSTQISQLHQSMSYFIMIVSWYIHILMDFHSQNLSVRSPTSAPGKE